MSKNSKKCIENLVEIKSLQKDDAITSMVWGNEEQTEILIGKKNQQVIVELLIIFLDCYLTI